MKRKKKIKVNPLWRNAPYRVDYFIVQKDGSVEHEIVRHPPSLSLKEMKKLIVPTWAKIKCLKK